MKRLLRISLSLTFVFVFVFAASAQKTIDKITKNKIIRIGMTGNQPPYCMEDKEGNLIGFEVDIANLLAESMGIELDIVQMPFKDLMPSLEAGKIDAIMSGMTITLERNAKAAFIGPYMLSGKSILAKESNINSADETDELNQADLKLTALKGSTSEKFIELFLPDATYVPADSYDQAIEMIRNNEVKAMVGDYAMCIVNAMKYEEEGFVTLAEPLTLEPIGMALPPNDPLFVNFMENYMSALIMNGLFNDLEEYWFESGGWLIRMK